MIEKATIEFTHNSQEESRAAKQTPDRKSHVGFYLIDAGHLLLEKSINYQPGWRAGLRGWFLAHPTSIYLGSISFLSLLIVLSLLSYTYAAGSTLPQLILGGLLGFLLALDVSTNLVNWDVTHQIRPHSLPRMDFSEGIPTNCRTMVVIPTLLTTVNELDSLLQELELHFLRIETLAPAVIRWTADESKTYQEIKTLDDGLGIHMADLPSDALREGKQIKFTFYWPDADHWEGKDFVVRVGSFHRDGTASAERSETDEK